MKANPQARCILLVEDNPDDAALTIGALRSSRVANEIVHAKDGAEARDFLFGIGDFAGRDVCQVPDLVLLDLRLPKIDGIYVLRRSSALWSATAGTYGRKASRMEAQPSRFRCGEETSDQFREALEPIE